MASHVRLWLDDQKPAPEGWTVVTTIDAARSLLATGVDEISLGDRLDREHGRGLELVLWMATTGHWPKRQPHVHGGHRVRGTALKAASDLAWRFKKPARRATIVAENVLQLVRSARQARGAG
jgi:hypothetical protein